MSLPGTCVAKEPRRQTTLHALRVPGSGAASARCDRPGAPSLVRPLLVATTLFASSTIASTACDTPVEAADARPTARAIAQASKAASVSMTASAAPPAIVPVAGKPVLWGYVDGAGVAHFASRQIDAHYSQVLRETESPHVTGKKQQTDGLLTWLEISPDVRAVQPLVDEAAKQTGVDEELLKAVITVESS